eukprot:8756362-Pyramimonas_sp.AAC.1
MRTLTNVAGAPRHQGGQHSDMRTLTDVAGAPRHQGGQHSGREERPHQASRLWDGETDYKPGLTDYNLAEQ